MDAYSQDDDSTSFKIPTPPALDAWTLAPAGGEFAVLSFDIRHAAQRALTAAEAEVARELIAGASNDAIARSRNTSVRTVANQIASLYRKLGVGSRRELLVRAVFFGAQR